MRLFSRLPAYRDEQSTLMAKRSYPTELRQPLLGIPDVDGAGEQVVGLAGQQRTWIGTNVFDIILREPSLHFSERVPMLLGMLILIAQPGLAPRRIVARA